jgi:outer membrane usher protein
MARMPTPRFLLPLLTLVGLLVAASPLAAEQQPAMLDVSINGVAHGQTLVVIDSGEVWIDLASLTDAGVKDPGGDRRAWKGRTLVRLGSVSPQITYEFDEAALSLRLTVRPSLLEGSHFDLMSGRPDDVEYRHATSAFLNYGTSVLSVGTSSMSLEAGVSAGHALVTSTMFGDTTGTFRRGLTSVTFDDRHHLNRYVVGDTVATTGALGGAVQLGGASVSRDFSLDPYFVRFPTLDLSGAVMTPSRIEVYVNNQLVRVEQLPPGVYQLDHLPLPVGAGDTRVVVRDAFGGEQTVDSSFYISQGVLARGVQQFSYSAGAERNGQFESSWSYGRPVVAGLHRVGLTDSITVGGRFEAGSNLASGGPMATIRIGRLGEVEGIGALSRSADGPGYASSLAYEYSSRGFGVSMAARSYSAAYATLSSQYLLARPRLDTSAAVTTRVASRATVGATWQSLQYYAGYPASKRGALTTSATLTQRLSLVISANRTLALGRWDTGGFAGLGLSFGTRNMANVSAERVNGRVQQSADLQHSLPVGTGVGYHVQGTTDPTGSGNLDAELRAQTPFGRYAVRQTVIDGQASTVADASGAIVLIGGGVHLTRPVEDGFALVRVPDVSGVRAYVSNQEVGRTDRRGDLVVPNLLAYYGNHVSINDADVPLDRDVPRDAMLLAPPFRGGAIALFPAPRPWRVVGQFVVMQDHTVVTPANWGLTVKTASGSVSSALGSDGAFYLEGLAPGDYEATIAGDGLVCRAMLRVPPSDRPVIKTGVTTCTTVSRTPRGETR